MKIIKKISLIIIGIILSLIILEIGLQLSGFTLTAIKKYGNKKTKDSNTITILCLGESTTDGQWPPVLQKILDEKSKNKKFNVVDEGVVGTNTKKISEKIVDFLLKYNPDIVISMIGINDGGLVYQQSKIKILNLIKLICFHILTHYFYTDASYSEIDSECMDLRKTGNFLLIKQKYYNLLEKSKFSDKNVYFRLWELINFMQEIDISFYDKLLKCDIFITDSTLEFILKYLIAYKNYDTEQIKDFLIENKYRLLYDYNSAILIKILKKYEVLYLLEDIKNNKNKADYNKINFKTLNSKNDSLVKNYMYIINETKSFNNKILFIPMQYPTLSVEDLKQNLKDSPYYDNLIFISNEENFKNALQNHKTEEIFIDMFAGNFGHCTDLGNTLIAENVAETILNLYN